MKSAGENIAMTVCVVSTSHNNDVIFMKISQMSPMKFPTKRIFQIFSILKIDRITSFCYLFLILPSYI